MTIRFFRVIRGKDFFLFSLLQFSQLVLPFLPGYCCTRFGRPSNLRSRAATVLNSWKNKLNGWVDAGIIDEAAAGRIRAFESNAEQQQKLHLPVIIAVSLGGLLAGAGILLFVAAHWDNLSPAYRFTLVLLMVGVVHTSGALLTERFPALSTALHGVGTAALGAGIFLAAQIFNLEEHWPGGLMLWAAGAWIAWWLKRDWVQGVCVALLTPSWLLGEWVVAAGRHSRAELIPAEGALLLAIVYFTVQTNDESTNFKRALTTIGAIALIPSVILVVAAANELVSFRPSEIPLKLRLIGWLAAFVFPLVIALWSRRRDAWISILAALWVACLGTTRRPADFEAAGWFQREWHDLGPYLVCAIGAVGMVWWGLRESRKARINIGVAGFALTILLFYFSSVMDKLGRSVGLIGLGALFLAGGWLLERMRRRLVRRLAAN